MNISPNNLKIGMYAKACLESLHQLQDIVNQKKERLDAEFFESCQTIFQSMKKNLEVIVASHTKTETSPIHFNELLNVCLMQAIEEEAKIHPEFTFTLTKKFDPSIQKTLLSFSEDLILIFIQIFNNALSSMRHKKELRGAAYMPELDIRTINYKEYIEIIIRDNGLGIIDAHTKNLPQSFKGTQIGFPIAYDVIISAYSGTIRVESIDGEYFQLILTFPNNVGSITNER